MQLLLVIIAAAALAYANGANDNFKGVATLFGSGTLRYRQALLLATVATAAGAVLSAALAQDLARTFTGRGLVGAEVATSSRFLIVTGVSAALTVLIATRLGMPTSTTHALTGALAGAALAAGGEAASLLPALSRSFLLPLIVSPLLALSAVAALELLLRAARGGRGSRAGRRAEASDEAAADACLCVGPAVPCAAPARAFGPPRALAVVPSSWSLGTGSREECARRWPAAALRLGSGALLDAAHVLSAGAVCFARAVNDTPKLAALLLASGGLAASPAPFGLVALAMTLGGLLGARQVAETMSRRITDMSPRQGLTANLVTASLVLGASHAGLPVSTTHVSVGSLFGLGLAGRSARGATIRRILVTWVVTLPLALACGAAAWSAWAHWSPPA